MVCGKTRIVRTEGLALASLAAALMQNAKEGKPGQLSVSTSIPSAGYLLAPPTISLAESSMEIPVASINSSQRPIDFFITIATIRRFRKPMNSAPSSQTYLARHRL